MGPAHDRGTSHCYPPKGRDRRNDRPYNNNPPNRFRPNKRGRNQSGTEPNRTSLEGDREPHRPAATETTAAARIVESIPSVQFNNTVEGPPLHPNGK
jgi:hypothetical protein